MTDKFVSNEVTCGIDYITKHTQKSDFIGELVKLTVGHTKDAILLAKLIRFVSPDCSKLKFDLLKTKGELVMTIRRIK